MCVCVCVCVWRGGGGGGGWNHLTELKIGPIFIIIPTIIRSGKYALLKTLRQNFDSLSIILAIINQIY